MVNNKIRYLGICSFARCGKDTAAKLIQHQLKKHHNLNSEILSFADELRRELAPFLKENYGLDIYNLTEDQKKIARPVMVACGELHRAQNPNFFIEKLHDKVCEKIFLQQNPDEIKYVLVPDVRFLNECDYIKKYNGKLIFIEKYNINRFGDKTKFGPPNQQEAENIPPIKQLSNYQISWEHLELPKDINIEQLDKRLGHHVRLIVDSIVKKY